MPSPPAEDGRRAAGQKTRDLILHTAANLATVEGLEGLSIGRLAEEVGMSKSGLYAHFGSKEELQLAIVEKAEGIFRREVIRPGLSAPKGLPRVLSLLDRYVDYIERHVFAGGCFFVAAETEMGPRSGPLHDRVRESRRVYISFVEKLIRQAQEMGHLPPQPPARQLVFELGGILTAANNLFLLEEDPWPLEMARRSVRRILGVDADEAASTTTEEAEG